MTTMIKAATHPDLPKVEDIMKRIHDEEPSYWPYGLDADQFNGGLFMVQKEANHTPVGFVGWQKFEEDDRQIGYYAIGILPEHRERSFAKQAVTQVIRRIGNECDEIRAMVMTHNEPSKALARSVDVKMIEKLASTKAQLLSTLGAGVGTTALFDQAADPERSVASTLQPWKWDKERVLMGGLNALLGGLGGQRMAKGEFGQGLGAIALAPTKDLAIKGVGSLHKIDEAAKKFSAGEAGGIPKGALIGAGGLGLGALGLLAYNAKRKADHQDSTLAAANKGRVRITLPTKEKGDNETEIELPFDELNLSNALRGRLGRDTRRRLYAETKQRTAKKTKKDSPTAEANKKLEVEREKLDKAASLADLVDEIGFYKSASGGISATSVPSPPQVGQNPALRMGQQEQAVAQSIQAAPEGNPQVIEAQQAAAAAEQAGAQQVAEIEAGAQQAQMEQQQRFQQEMMKSDQEKEVLKLQLEKEKALRELSSAQNQSAGADGSNQATEAQKLVSNRLGRLSSRVKRAATQPATAPKNPVPVGTPGTLNPENGQVIPDAKPIHLKPHAANRINAHAGSTAMIPNIGVYRHSYGPILDSVYGMFRQKMLTPTPPRRAAISQSDMMNTPDKLGLISQYLSSARG